MHLGKQLLPGTEAIVMNNSFICYVKFSFPNSGAEMKSLKVTCVRLAINYGANIVVITKAPFRHAMF